MSKAQGSTGDRVDTLVMPPEKHISVPKNELRLALKNRLELSDRARFDDLVKLMEGVASFDFVDVKRRMRANFTPFACGARGEAAVARADTAPLGEAELDDKARGGRLGGGEELEFVGDAYDVLRASHYHLLTDGEWDIALAESFQLNLPLEIDWAYMDPSLLTRFWESSRDRKELRSHLPDEVADRVLVFHRGIGSASIKGLLIEEKLDLLCEYTVFRVLNKLAPLLRGARKAEKAAANVGAAEAAAAAAAAAASEGGPAHGEALRCDSALQGEMKGGMYIASDHKYAKVVERQTLKRLCPTLLTLLKSFPKALELQEPTFRDIVVIYRRALPKADVQPDDPLQAMLAKRNIYVKVFGETPMADVELIFPSKRVGIKPFNLINLIVTVVTALVSGGLVLLKAGKDISMNIVWTAGSLVLTRCFQVYTTAQTQKTQMQHDMSSQLYDKMQDSQEGVISAIMEEMADQQFKQMLLAYMLLLLKDRPLKVDDLDGLCEDFLVKDFDHRIDYQVEDSLPRLERWGLVSHNEQGKLVALPLDEAIQALAFAWAIAYRALGSGAAASVPTADLLTGRGSSFGPELDAYRAGRAAELAAAATAGKKGMFSKAKDKLSFSRASSGASKQLRSMPSAAARAAPAAAAALAAAEAGDKEAAAAAAVSAAAAAPVAAAPAVAAPVAAAPVAPVSTGDSSPSRLPPRAPSSQPLTPSAAAAGPLAPEAARAPPPQRAASLDAGASLEGGESLASGSAMDGEGSVSGASTSKDKMKKFFKKLGNKSKA
ncbi:MAG: hypothetical protein J3K34DRAFT_527436 [Monoraphidium minutum]|nr:MAG: hypothetical protein J3K34DRAFT_527436 [Monoraphidium minutum]